MDAYQSQYILQGLASSHACLLGSLSIKKSFLPFLFGLARPNAMLKWFLIQLSEEIAVHFLISYSQCYPFSTSDGFTQVLRTLVSPNKNEKPSPFCRHISDFFFTFCCICGRWTRHLNKRPLRFIRPNRRVFRNWTFQVFASAESYTQLAIIFTQKPIFLCL